MELFAGSGDGLEYVEEADMHAIEISETATDTDAELREILDDLARGIRRPERMREACDRMDRMREENRLLFGEQDIAVALTRETRCQ